MADASIDSPLRWTARARDAEPHDSAPCPSASLLPASPAGARAAGSPPPSRALSAVPSRAAEPIVLRVGDQKGGNRSLLEISASKGPALHHRLSEFPAAAPILEALNAGALDVGYTGDLSLLTAYAAGAPIKAIGGTKSDPRSQAILVRQDSTIRSAADLKGKRLAAPAAAGGQFLIDATLEKAGIKLEDATFAALNPVDAKVALVAGSVDAWAVWEPYVSFATLKDKARVIADGESLTPTITFIVASDSAIATKRAAVQDLLERLNKARLWSLDHLDTYARSTAALTRKPADRAARGLRRPSYPARSGSTTGWCGDPGGVRSRHALRDPGQAPRRDPGCSTAAYTAPAPNAN